MNTLSRSCMLSLAVVGDLLTIVEQLSFIRDLPWAGRHVVSNAQQALRLGRTCRISLWFVARHLPDACGFASVSLLKEWQPNAHYCVIGDHYSVEDERRAFQLGRTTFLMPPLNSRWFEDYLLHVQVASEGVRPRVSLIDLFQEEEEHREC